MSKWPEIESRSSNHRGDATDVERARARARSADVISRRRLISFPSLLVRQSRRIQACRLCVALYAAGETANGVSVSHCVR